jgi:hypothetical protein
MKDPATVPTIALHLTREEAAIVRQSLSDTYWDSPGDVELQAALLSLLGRLVDAIRQQDEHDAYVAALFADDEG